MHHGQISICTIPSTSISFRLVESNTECLRAGTKKSQPFFYRGHCAHGSGRIRQSKDIFFSFRMVLSWLRKLRNVAVLFMVTITSLVAWPVYAASDVSRAHDRPLRLAIVNTYGQILSNIYYGESLKKIRAAIAPRPLEIRIYGPDTFLDAARNDQFDMSIASYGLTSIMLRQTGGARVLTAVNKRFPDPYAGKTVPPSLCDLTGRTSTRSKICQTNRWR